MRTTARMITTAIPSKSHLFVFISFPEVTVHVALHTTITQRKGDQNPKNSSIASPSTVRSASWPVHILNAAAACSTSTP